MSDEDRPVIDLGHYDDGGPVQAGYRFIDAILEDDYDLAWSLMDDNLRLCRA